MPDDGPGRDGASMAWALAELLVDLPHLVAIDRLPERVEADGVTVELAGGHGAAAVVGSLHAHVREARWRRGRRHGAARYEILRTHPDRCAVTVALDGADVVTAYRVALAARRELGRRPVIAAPTVRPAPITKPA
jgi:hypothetical protein